MAMTASINWSHLAFKLHNAVLGEVKDNISFESCMELCNAPLSSLTELFLNGALGREAEKSSRVLHDKVTRKAVTMQKKQQKHSKKIQFSQPAPWRQVLRNSDSQPSKTLSGKGSSLFFFKTDSSSSSSKFRKGKKF